MSDNKMTVIEGPEYEACRKRLMEDPIVKEMAEDIKRDNALAQLVHEDGSPRFEFMMAANREYDNRGGEDGGHIGAIAEAIVRLVKA